MADRRPVVEAGQIYGRLRVVALHDVTAHGNRRYLCSCECGSMKVVRGNHLRSGRVMSCGCLRNEMAPKLRLTHGHTVDGRPTRTYTSWVEMRRRCLNPDHRAYPDYGGRGIVICDEWADFERFLADMGPRPEGTSIDRIDNDGNYEPGNCRWATRSEQASNRRPWNWKRKQAEALTGP